MAKKDMSILFTAQDNLSKEIEKMRSNVKKMGKDVADYKTIQDKAFKEKAELQLDMRKAKQELKDLAKLERDGTEESKQNYIAKQKEINEMQEGVKRYGQAINEANKAERDLSKTSSRNRNNPNYNGGKDGGSATSQIASLGQNLIKAGIAKELGQSLGNATSAYISSAYGDKIGNRVGTVAGSTLSMAGMGAVVAGPIGAAVGAGAGVIKGSLDAFTNEKKISDGFFRDEVQNIYTQVSELNANTLEGGIILASQREMDVIAFKNILGSQENADRFISDTEVFAARTPFDQDELLNLGKTMRVYGTEQDDIIPKLTKLGDAFAALGIDVQGKQSVTTSLGLMESTQKVDLKNIKVLQSRGIDAVGILAEKMEVSKQKTYEMISKGAINGADAARIITDAVGKEYEGAMDEFQQTYQGLSSTLTNLQEKGDRSEGEGYNEKRKEGIQAEIEYLETLATKDREYIGEYKATLKNKEEELMRSTMEATKSSQEYKEAQAGGDGAKLGELLSDAQTKAMVEWQNSPEMQKLHEAELARAKATQNYIRDSGEYVKFGQTMAEQFNRGWSKTIDVGAPKGSGKNKDKSNRVSGRRRATGGRIPDDYYPFMADKNERVLTASENLQWERNKGKGNGVSIGNINVSVEGSNASADDIATTIATKITEAMENTA